VNCINRRLTWINHPALFASRVTSACPRWGCFASPPRSSLVGVPVRTPHGLGQCEDENWDRLRIEDDHGPMCEPMQFSAPLLSNVRVVSTTALTPLKRDFRSVPESRHSQCSLGCLKRAMKRHCVSGRHLKSRPEQTCEDRKQGNNAYKCHHDRAFLVSGDSQRLRLFVAQLFDPDSRRSCFDSNQTIRPNEPIR
jgi:hypothetical protein